MMLISSTNLPKFVGMIVHSDFTLHIRKLRPPEQQRISDSTRF